MSRSGQTMILDFAIAFFVFMLAFGVLTVFWINGLEEKIQQDNYIEMDLKANIAAKMLVKSIGEPSNWEELDSGLVEKLGLVFHDLSVDEQKLTAFQNFDYDKAKRLLNISEYDFFFDFVGVDNVSMGLAPLANVDTIKVSRIVEYKGGEGTASITLYRA